MTSKTTLDPARESFESAKAFFVVSEWKRSVLSAVLLGFRVPTNEEIERRTQKLFPCYNARHKSTWKIADVETEVELILARAAIFTFLENIAQLTICPYHRSSLGIGWRSGSQRCQIPRDLSNHSDERKWPRGKRGLGKLGSNFVYQKTGVFVPVGSGMHR